MRNKTLIDLNTEISKIPGLEKKKVQMHSLLEESTYELESFKKIYEKKLETADKKQLSEAEGSKLQRLFAKHYGKSEKSQQEADEARLLYEENLKKHTELKTKTGELEERLGQLRSKKKTFEREMRCREHSISTKSSHGLFLSYHEIIKELNHAVAQLIYNEKAFQTLRRLIVTVSSAEKCYETAELWADSESLRGVGIVRRTSNKRHIDEMQEVYGRLATQMTAFRSELDLVALPSRPPLVETDFEDKTASFWFDNILSASQSVSILRNNQIQMRMLGRQLEYIDDVLTRNSEKIQVRIEKLEKEKMELVIMCQTCEEQDELSPCKV